LKYDAEKNEEEFTLLHPFIPISFYFGKNCPKKYPLLYLRHLADIHFVLNPQLARWQN